MDGSARACRSPAAPKRTAPVFNDRREAEEWLQDGVAELQAGRSLPNPDAYRRRREPVSQPPQLRTVSQAVHHWHRETFDSLQAAQPKRRRQVLDDLTNHLLPFLDQLGITELDAVSREVIVDFARFLGGWPLLHHAEGGPNDRRLAGSTASRILNTVVRFLDAMVARQRLPANPATGVGALQPYGGTRTTVSTEPLTLAQCARLASQLSVTHQTVLWLLRILGLRIGEAYGLRVRDITDLGDYGLVHLQAQGGTHFEVRDAYGKFTVVTDKDRLKTRASNRILWVPPTLMRVLRTVIEAFHTDPDTGEVDPELRLIPGIRVDDQGGQDAFRAALKAAGKATELSDDDLTRRLHPHHLRRSVTTEVRMAGSDELPISRYLGHRAGAGVTMQHYMLDQPEHRKMQDIAAFLDEQVREEVGSLLVPTSRTNQWGVGTRTYQRSTYVDMVLELHGWQVPTGDGGDPWLSSAQVADLLGLHQSKAREMMADGRVPATRRAWGTRRVWMARRSDVERIRRQRDDRLDLNELGMSYHEAYQTLGRLGQLPAGAAKGRRLEITEANADALRRECDRVAALHNRAMRISAAARLLPRSERTLRDYVGQGRLERDPETDPSGHTFVTRASVEALRQALEPSAPVTTAAVPDAVSRSRASELTGLSRSELATLVRVGTLSTATVGRASHITLDSLQRWAVGYRPDLVEPVTRLREAS